jgi:hypothetical protein
VADLLQSSLNDAIKRFRDGWLQHQETTEGGGRAAYAERVRRIPISEVIAAAESEEGSFPNFRGWGMYASDEDQVQRVSNGR